MRVIPLCGRLDEVAVVQPEIPDWRSHVVQRRSGALTQSRCSGLHVADCTEIESEPRLNAD